jgi:hypothetical protein
VIEYDISESVTIEEAFGKPINNEIKTKCPLCLEGFKEEKNV